MTYCYMFDLGRTTKSLRLLTSHCHKQNIELYSFAIEFFNILIFQKKKKEETKLNAYLLHDFEAKV